MRVGFPRNHRAPLGCTCGVPHPRGSSWRHHTSRCSARPCHPEGLRSWRCPTVRENSRSPPTAESTHAPSCRRRKPAAQRRCTRPKLLASPCDLTLVPRRLYPATDLASRQGSTGSEIRERAGRRPPGVRTDPPGEGGLILRAFEVRDQRGPSRRRLLLGDCDQLPPVLTERVQDLSRVVLQQRRNEVLPRGHL